MWPSEVPTDSSNTVLRVLTFPMDSSQTLRRLRADSEQIPHDNEVAMSSLTLDFEFPMSLHGRCNEKHCVDHLSLRRRCSASRAPNTGAVERVWQAMCACPECVRALWQCSPIRRAPLPCLASGVMLEALPQPRRHDCLKVGGLSYCRGPSPCAVGRAFAVRNGVGLRPLPSHAVAVGRGCAGATSLWSPQCAPQRR